MDDDLNVLQQVLSKFIKKMWIISMANDILLVAVGFPPIREFREIRENFEDFFSVREIREKQGVFSQNQGKKFHIRELFSQPFPNLLNL